MPIVRFATSSPKDYAEGDGFIISTVELSEASAQVVTVKVTGVGSTAFDVDVSPQTITFQPGETSKPFRAAIYDDAYAEDAEGYLFELSTPTNATLDTASSSWRLSGSILASDPGGPRGVFSIAGPTPSAKPEGSSYTFTVTRTGDIGAQALVWYTIGGSGTSPISEGDIWGFTANSLIFAVGQTSATIVVESFNDQIGELDEEFTVTINPRDAGAATVSSATAVILNDDGPILPFVSLKGSLGGPEGNREQVSFLYTVTRTGNLNITSTVSYGLADGYTVQANDFRDGRLPSGSVTFAPGETSKTISVAIANDSEIENHEFYTLVLKSAVGAIITGGGAPSAIQNDDPSQDAVITGAARLAEGQPFTFTITRDSTGTAATFTYKVQSWKGTASADDFAGGVFPSGSVSFLPGELSKTIVVGIANDAVVEADETFAVDLYNAAAENISIVGATILNDDGLSLPSQLFVFPPTTSVEGNAGSSPHTFTFTRSGPVSSPGSFSYAVMGSAVTGADFVGGVLPSGTVTFGSNEITKSVVVNVAGDTQPEENEPYLLILSNPLGVIFPNQPATGFIRDDDAATTTSSTFSVSGPRVVTELDSGFLFSVFTVARSGNLNQGGSVDYVIEGLTANDEFGEAEGRIGFIAGDVGITKILKIKGDTIAGPDRDVRMVLRNPVGGTIGTGSATTTVLDNDKPSAPDASATLLRDAFTNILSQTPTLEDGLLIAGLAGQVAAGQITRDGALTQILNRADGTTSVATLAYQFFTGKIPSQDGMTYLVSPAGPNPNNLNSAYYQSFSTENRYINFAVNLGKVGEGKDKFAAEYGGLDLAAATTKAYTAIFGAAPTPEKVQQLLTPTFSVGGQTMTRAEYFAYYGGDGPNGIGTKAAMVGWLLAEAEKADIGMYSKANHAFLADLADGATYAVDLIGTYGKPEFAL